MNNISFWESVLSLFTLVDGKTLSYGYSNRETPSLLSYIENHDDSSRHFLELCVDRMQDILNEKFGFLQQSECKTV